MSFLLPNQQRQSTKDTHTHTHTQPFYCSSGICPGPPGCAGTRKVKPGRLKPIWIYWSSGFTGARDMILINIPWSAKRAPTTSNSSKITWNTSIIFRHLWRHTYIRGAGRQHSLTCGRCAMSITCVMAAGGRMGLWAGKSVAEAGCSFTFITWTKRGNHR